MEGYQKKHLLPHASIFLRYRELKISEESCDFLGFNEESNVIERYPNNSLLQEDKDTLIISDRPWNSDHSAYADRTDRSIYESSRYSSNTIFQNVN